METSWTWIQSHATLLIWWYVVGILASLVWPIHFRKNMEASDWLSVAKGLPFLALLGPVALINFPI